MATDNIFYTFWREIQNTYTVYPQAVHFHKIKSPGAEMKIWNFGVNFLNTCKIFGLYAIVQNRVLHFDLAQ
jgi:hypothetical protein